jgi:hypothetical protein
MVQKLLRDLLWCRLQCLWLEETKQRPVGTPFSFFFPLMAISSSLELDEEEEEEEPLRMFA